MHYEHHSPVEEDIGSPVARTRACNLTAASDRYSRDNYCRPADNVSRQRLCGRSPVDKQKQQQVTRRGASVSTAGSLRRWRVARVVLARRAQQLGGRLDRPALVAGRDTARLTTGWPAPQPSPPTASTPRRSATCSTRTPTSTTTELQLSTEQVSAQECCTISLSSYQYTRLRVYHI